MAKDQQREWILNKLSAANKAVYESLPLGVAAQLTMERDPHGNVQVSLIETEKLLSEMVANKLAAWKKEGKFNGKVQLCIISSAMKAVVQLLPTTMRTIAMLLGTSAAMLMANGKTGYMAIVKNTTAPAAEWIAGGVPITMMMNMEKRNGEMKPVIKRHWFVWTVLRSRNLHQDATNGLVKLVSYIPVPYSISVRPRSATKLPRRCNWNKLSNSFIDMQVPLSVDEGTCYFSE